MRTSSRPIPSLLFIFFTLLGLTTPAFSVQGGEIISGEFELLDHAGQPVNKTSYKGKFRLVFFGFTNCPDICPTTLAHVTKVMKILANDGQHVQPLFITIDHKNDTVDRMASYVAAFHPSIIGLTGTEEQIRNAAAAFNVTYGLGGFTNEFYHSSYLYLMGRDGEFIDLFGYGAKAEIIVSKLREYL